MKWPDSYHILVISISPCNKKLELSKYLSFIFPFFFLTFHYNVDYVEEIFQTFLTATKEELKGAADKLKDMTPPPMNTMLEKESRSSAVKKKIDRSKKITQNVPPTTPGISSHILTSILLVLWFYFSLYMCIKHVLLHTKIIDLFVCVKDLKHNSNAILHFRKKSHICLNLLPLNIVISHNPFWLP